MRENRHFDAAPDGRPAIDGFGPKAVRQRVYITGRERRVAAAAELDAMERQTLRRTAVQLDRYHAPEQHAQPKQPAIDMELPGEASKAREHPSFRVRVKSARRRTLQATAMLVVALVGVWGLLFIQGLLSAHNAFKGGGDHAAALQEGVDPNLLKGEGSGRINILLMGIGGKGHSGPDLTDTMMVASVDPVNHKTVLLSIPRDLWVAIPSKGSMKINAAYPTGKYAQIGRIDGSSTDTKAIRSGFAMADKTVEQVLGIQIHYNFLLNFQAFKQAVDAVDGVNVNVPETLYDPTMAWENNWNSVIAKKGPQEFTGKQALLYVRSRETSSDFARSQRQRAVMLALKQKIADLGTVSNPIKLSGLLSSFGHNVVTDLSLRDASRLYDILKKIPSQDVTSVGLGDYQNKLLTTGRVGNQSIVRPIDGLSDFERVQLFVRKTLPDGFIIKEGATVLVLNGTSEVGRADAQVTELQSYGYKVLPAANAPTSTYDKTVLINVSGAANPYTKHYLERRYGVKSTKLPSDLSLQKGSADFILIVGRDATAS
jgi:LCP family protein required for cell wall assembly